MAGLYDLDVEAQVLDDFARAWDDPDQEAAGSATASPASVAVTATTNTLTGGAGGTTAALARTTTVPAPGGGAAAAPGAVLAVVVDAPQTFGDVSGPDDPSTLTSATFWLDSDDLTTQVIDGSGLHWTDKINSWVFASDATNVPAQVTLRGRGAFDVSSHGSVQYDLDTDTPATWTICVVAETNDGSQQWQTVVAAMSPVEMFEAGFWDANQVGSWVNGGGFGYGYAAPSYPHIFRVTYDGTTARCYVDGDLKWARDPVAGGTQFSFGGGNATDWLDGTFGDAVMLDGIDADDTFVVERYLAWKYQLMLPGFDMLFDPSYAVTGTTEITEWLDVYAGLSLGKTTNPTVDTGMWVTTGPSLNASDADFNDQPTVLFVQDYDTYYNFSDYTAIQALYTADDAYFATPGSTFFIVGRWTAIPGETIPFWDGAELLDSGWYTWVGGNPMGYELADFADTRLESHVYTMVLAEADGVTMTGRSQTWLDGQDPRPGVNPVNTDGNYAFSWGEDFAYDNTNKDEPDANGVAFTSGGLTWQVVSGTWQFLNDSYLSETSSGWGVIVAAGYEPDPVHMVRVQIEVTDNAQNGIVVNWHGGANSGAFHAALVEGDDIVLYRHDFDDSWHELARCTTTTFVPNAVLQVFATGQQITVWYDGAAVIPYTFDDSLTTESRGSIGLYASESGTQRFHGYFDVKKPSSSRLNMGFGYNGGNFADWVTALLVRYPKALNADERAAVHASINARFGVGPLAGFTVDAQPTGGAGGVTTDVPITVWLPAPTASTPDATAHPSTVVVTATVNALTGGAGGTTSALVGTATINAPAVGAGGATIAPVARAVTVNAPVGGAGGATTALARAATINAPAVGAGGTTTAVASTTTLPAPGGGSTGAISGLALGAFLLAPSASAGGTTTALVVTVTTNLATATASATATPNPVVVGATVNTPTGSAGGTTSALLVAAFFPAPSASTGGTTTALALSVAFPTPAIGAGGTTTALLVPVTVPPATASAPDGSAFPSPVVASVTAPSPAGGAGGTTSALGALATFPQPAVGAGGTTTALLVTVAALQPSVATGATASPAPVVVAVTVTAPTVGAGGTTTALAGALAPQTPAGGAGGTTQGLALGVTVPELPATGETFADAGVVAVGVTTSAPRGGASGALSAPASTTTLPQPGGGSAGTTAGLALGAAARTPAGGAGGTTLGQAHAATSPAPTATASAVAHASVVAVGVLVEALTGGAGGTTDPVAVVVTILGITLFTGVIPGGVVVGVGAGPGASTGAGTPGGVDVRTHGITQVALDVDGGGATTGHGRAPGVVVESR